MIHGFPPRSEPHGRGANRVVGWHRRMVAVLGLLLFSFGVLIWSVWEFPGDEEERDAVEVESAQSNVVPSEVSLEPRVTDTPVEISRERVESLTPSTRESSIAAERRVELDLFVCDATGHAIPDVRIDIGVRSNNDRSDPSPVGEVAETDDHGQARLSLVPGDYFVIANRGAGRGHQSRYSTEFAQVTVRAERTETMIRLLEETSSLRCVVTDQGGGPVPGIGIVEESGSRRMTTDEAGSVVFPRIYSGRVTARIWDPSGAASRSFYFATTSKECVVETGGEGLIEFEVLRAGSLDIRVTGCTTDQPIEIIAQQIVPEGSPTRRVVAQAMPGTGASIETIYPGWYRVWAEFPSDVDCVTTRASMVEILPGEESEVIVEGHAEPGVVNGRVVDWGGMGRIDVRVSVTGPAPSTWRKEIETDGAGEFSLRGIPNVPISLSINAIDAPGEMLAQYGPGVETSLTIDAPRSGLRLIMPRGFELKGRVDATDDDATLPEGLIVHVDDSDGVAITTGRVRKSATFSIPNLGAGVYRVWCAPAGEAERGVDVVTVDVGSEGAVAKITLHYSST